MTIAFMVLVDFGLGPVLYFMRRESAEQWIREHEDPEADIEIDVISVSPKEWQRIRFEDAHKSPFIETVGVQLTLI